MTTLSGKVTAEGRPATDAVVELHNAQGDVVDQVTVDAEGRYRYFVSPAAWGLRVWDSQGRAARGDVSVAEGEDRVFDIELTQAGGAS